MGNTEDRDLCSLQLRFVGKIIAGFTHEIKNRLAVINESAGLMGDMISIGKSAGDNASEYIEIIRSIEDEIEKTNTQFRYLNRFAHRMDTELSVFNMNECLEELTALLRRFANQKKMDIAHNFQGEMPEIRSNPSMLHLLVFGVIEEIMTKFDKESRIMLKTEYSNNTFSIRITPEGKRIDVDSGTALFPPELRTEVATRLGGNISQEEKEETVIALPANAR
jgi:nitrogen-specific signal transduction histidine kinase